MGHGGWGMKSPPQWRSKGKSEVEVRGMKFPEAAN